MELKYLSRLENLTFCVNVFVCLRKSLPKISIIIERRTNLHVHYMKEDHYMRRTEEKFRRYGCATVETVWRSDRDRVIFQARF